MKAMLELHYLQTFAPSNLNRDDTGSPKDAFFGGSRRLRVSSQAFKRAMRMDFADRGLLSPAELGKRTKRAHHAIARKLAEMGHDEAQARTAAMLALGTLGIKFKEPKKGDEDGEYKSSYLIFMGDDELTGVAELLHDNWATISENLGGKKPSFPNEFVKELKPKMLEKMDGSRAVDVALFGRMLADLPERNEDAAAQVAHALSTHAMHSRQYDFYTAVDDFKPDDNAGADMIGTVEFASATLYRYACLDLVKLLENLQGDRELLERGLKAFLSASIYAAPTGKQNTFAAHNLPQVMVQVVRENTAPRNLAFAFEKSVDKRKDVYPERDGLLKASAEALAQEMKWQNSVFGDEGHARFVAHESSAEEIFGEAMPDVQALIDATVADAMQALARATGE